jgi:DNA-binding NarL/FixJ family response regulator
VKQPVAINVRNRRNRQRSNEFAAVKYCLLHGLSRGHTNAQIAASVSRSEKTLRNQLTTVYAKLSVANRAAAVAAYLTRFIGRKEPD